MNIWDVLSNTLGTLAWSIPALMLFWPARGEIADLIGRIYVFQIEPKKLVIGIHEKIRELERDARVIEHNQVLPLPQQTASIETGPRDPSEKLDPAAMAAVLSPFGVIDDAWNRIEAKLLEAAKLKNLPTTEVKSNPLFIAQQIGLPFDKIRLIAIAFEVHKLAAAKPDAPTALDAYQYSSTSNKIVAWIEVLGKS